MSAVSDARIHSTAVIDPKAELDSSVQVGPYAVVGAGVKLGPGCQLYAHAVVEGPSTFGKENVFHPFTRVGGPPQDRKYDGEPTTLTVGDNNTFREYVNVNRGTSQDRGDTRIGDRNWIMASVHIAHDCVVGNDIILANTVNLAGHVHIGDWVILGGYTGVHQFCKVGAHAMTGVSTVLLHDLPPYVMASGNSASAHGINTEGLRRRGYDKARITSVRDAYKLLYKSGLGLAEAKAELHARTRAFTEQGQVEQAQDMGLLAGFLDNVSRGIVR